MLEGMIMQNAAELGNSHVVKLLHKSRTPWLAKALLQIKADSGQSTEQMLGLMMCMMAIGGPAAAHI